MARYLVNELFPAESTVQLDGGCSSVPSLRAVNDVRGIALDWADQFRGRANHQAVAFVLCCLFVAAVSVHDAMLIVVNHQVISDVEQNPLGKWLLQVHDGEVWLFVLVKLAATALVCAVLVSLYQHKQRLGLMTVGGIAGFQAVLLGYLTFC